MKNALKMESWSPYVVGAGIGILSWFTFLTGGKALRISTAFEHREAIVKACNIREGMQVADVGAGTGLFSRLFAGKVGVKGYRTCHRYFR